MRRGLVALAVGALVLIVPAGASTSANNQPARATDKTPAAIQAVKLFTPANEEAFARLDKVIDGPGGIRLAALKPYLASGNVLRRWAAVYIASNTARKQSDYKLLQRPFHDRNKTVRALAAFALLGGGKKEAIPALIELLPFDDLLQYWEPPIPIAVAADYRLTFFTGAQFGLNYTDPVAQRRATAAQWSIWWKAVKGNIRWDRRAHKYRWKKTGAAASFIPAMAPAPPPTAQPRPFTPLADPVDAVTVNADTGTLTVNLQFLRGPGVSKSDRAAIQSAIANAVKFLNGAGRTGTCLKMDFKIDARFKDKDPPFPDGSKPMVITVVPGISGNKAAGQRSSVNVPNHSGTWRVEDLKTSYGPTAVAHEVSHVMKLGDEYREGQGPLDKESYMASVGSGVKMLQRHMDALALEFLKNKSARCLKYQLKFVPFHTSIDAWDQVLGNKHEYTVGRESKANIRTDFWVNPDTGEITPAGDTPCAGQGLNPKANTMSQTDYDNCKKNFPGGLGGNSELFGLSANPGALKCTVVQFTATRQRFRTTVTGTKQGNQLNLKLDVPDAENAHYVCNPQPPTGAKHDISLGMQGAKALSFTIASPPLIGGVTSKVFTYSEAHGSSGGTGILDRLQ